MVVHMSFWINRLTDQLGQCGDDHSLRVGVELLLEGQLLGRSFGFEPKGELALHVLSRPCKGLELLALKNRSYGEVSQPLYGHGGGGKSIRAWLIWRVCYRSKWSTGCSCPDRSTPRG